MADQPNRGRDIEDVILRVLASTEAQSGLTVEEVTAGAMNWPTDGVSSCLRRLTDQELVESRVFRLSSRGPRHTVYQLTADGRRVAEVRGLVRRAEG